MIAVTPLLGLKNVTEFEYLNNSLGVGAPVTINWGDGSLSYTNGDAHVYTEIGKYNIFDASCGGSDIIEVEVSNGDYIADQLYVTSSSVSSLVTLPHTFNISLSARHPINSVVLYASGSHSAPYQTTRGLRSHLVPEWTFVSQGKPVSELIMVGSPVYLNNVRVGYSAMSAVQFSDDMPGELKLMFTIAEFSSNLPINSRAYAGITHTIVPVVPDKLVITSDGANPINRLQWSDINIPYVVSLGSSQLSSDSILHYLSGDVHGVDFRAGCYGDSLTGIQHNYPAMNLVDEQCLPSGGYTRSSFFIPTSALSTTEMSNNVVACNYDPSNVEYTRSRKSPIQVTLSATGTFGYGGSSYNLTGVSTPFDIVALENRHEFYRKGEDYNVYDILNKSLPFELVEHPNLDTYLKAVAGEGDTLGKVYDRVHNFFDDHYDVDVCNVQSLISKARQFDGEIIDFDISLPEELRRIFNFSTIPLPRLIGTRCVCNTNFPSCVGCANSNICTICRFDKRSNLGDLLSYSDLISAGETLIYRENGDILFNFLTVESQDTSVFALQSLSAEPVYSKGVANFCFHRWDKRPQNNPVEGLVNYKDSRNMLNPALSSNSDWYKDNGVVEEMFNYILTQNLIDK